MTTYTFNVGDRVRVKKLPYEGVLPDVTPLQGKEGIVSHIRDGVYPIRVDLKDEGTDAYCYYSLAELEPIEIQEEEDLYI